MDELIYQFKGFLFLRVDVYRNRVMIRPSPFKTWTIPIKNIASLDMVWGELRITLNDGTVRKTGIYGRPAVEIKEAILSLLS